MQNESDDFNSRKLRKDKPDSQWALYAGQSKNAKDNQKSTKPTEKTSDNTKKTSVSNKKIETKRKLDSLPKRNVVRSTLQKSDISSKGKSKQETLTEKLKEKTYDTNTTNLSIGEDDKSKPIEIRHKLLRTPPPTSNIFSKSENVQKTLINKQKGKTSDTHTSILTVDEDDRNKPIEIRPKLLRTPPQKADFFSSKTVDNKSEQSENSEARGASNIKNLSDNNRLLDDVISSFSNPNEKLDQFESSSNENCPKPLIDSKQSTTGQSSDQGRTQLSPNKSQKFIDANQQQKKRPNTLYLTVYSTTPDKDNNEILEKNKLLKEGELKTSENKKEFDFELTYKYPRKVQTPSPKEKTTSQKIVKNLFFDDKNQHFVTSTTNKKAKRIFKSVSLENLFVNSYSSDNSVKNDFRTSQKENYKFHSIFPNHNNSLTDWHIENQEMALALTIEEATGLLPDYDGNEKHLETYIAQIDKLWQAIATLEAQDKVKFLLFLHLKLTRRAADAAKKIDFSSWETAKAGLRKEINPPANIEKAELKLGQVKQKEKESVEDFAKRVEDLLIALNKSYQTDENSEIIKRENDRKARRSFENGLFNKKLQDKAIGHGSKSFDDSVAYTVEQSLRAGIGAHDTQQEYSSQRYSPQRYNSQRKYCSFHRVNTHNTSECKAKRQNNNRSDNFANDSSYSKFSQNVSNKYQQNNFQPNTSSPNNTTRNNIRLSREDYFCVRCNKQGHTQSFCRIESPTESKPQTVSNNNGNNNNSRQNYTHNPRAPAANNKQNTIRNSNHVVMNDQFKINKNFVLPDSVSNNALTLEEAIREYEPDLNYEEAMREYEDDENSKN